METIVLFFSRTGNSKRISENIAKRLNLKTIEITDDQNWKGIWGFLKGGFYSVRGKSVNIKINGDISGFDQYIVVSPLWAGKPAPAVCEFIKQVGADKVNLVISCNGSDVGKDLEKYESENKKLKGSFGIVSNREDDEERINEIINNLK